MEPLSVYDESVKVRIEEWLNAFGEVLIEPYYPYGGSSGTRYFISSLSGFHDMVAKAPEGEVFGAAYFIYRPPRFPLVATDDYYPAELSTFGEGESRRELEQEFEECRECQVRFGELPLGPEAWWATSGDDSVIVA